ncbi:prephenate dehydrogenase [Filimonas lacunae]|uniref:Prephenate dehydrogenase n=2 Tax=Filimonas lacunae TaxID=477680 RepID=A0A173MLG2_9BACT|nr:prephenate and/or arogenate dehydrogenase [Filimonas lacunae]SIT33992.1 prephenate dehydrogenase [Filimonas lacunae]
MALALKEKGFAMRVIGVDANAEHCKQALELGLVDEIATLEAAIPQSDLIILAVPVGVCLQLLPTVMGLITSKQVVMDVGSTKAGIAEVVADAALRGRMVPTHPMWGTEYSGPAAAVKEAFVKKATVICDKEKCDADALALVEKVYGVLGMHIVYMNAVAHDVHVAYISHISHITSFALANTVLEKEKEEDAIFELASGGFESTVRLAKSNPAMWVPIFRQNRDNVLDVLNEHIAQLRKFKACLEKENYEYLQELIENANKIRKVLNRG